ncbi:MAG: DEAD/DEAH box helicase, partial [Oscillospiraceae bacterium]
MKFNELGISEEILKATEEMGYVDATEIQEKAIPAVLAGKDIIGRSSTGTGKTAAFAIPIIEMVSQSSDKMAVLILSPTRELAMQISDEIHKFAKYVTGVSIATVYGGQQMDIQIRQLRTAKIVIGTPGRVMDHIRRKTLRLENLKTIVLDEADEMLNMGFVDDIRTILETVPAEHQTVLFSATMPPAILRLTKDFQTDPTMLAVDQGKKTVDQINQSYYNIPQAGKNDALKLLLEYHKPKRALVFCNTKKMTDDLSVELNSNGFKSVALHGDLKQSQRTAVMNEFKSGRSKILIATDVAARGIDVDDVEAVFNYDIPMENEYYIHRIGRTGRAGKTGASYTLVANRRQLMSIKELERYINAPISEEAVPTIESIAEHRMSDFANDIRELIQGGIDDGWKSFVEDIVAEGFDPMDVAAALCAKLGNKNKRLATVRNVATAKGMISNSRTPNRTRSGSNVWIRATIGSSSRIGPNFIVGAIADGSGIPSSKIGKINIFDDYTDIELSPDDAQTVIGTMHKTRIKKQDVVISLVENSSGHQEQREK